MDKRTVLTNLRNTFAAIYEDEASAKRIATQAGIDTQRIALGGSPINRWHEIFNEAEKLGKTSGLIDEALGEYGPSSALQQAVADYRQLVQQREAAAPAEERSEARQATTTTTGHVFICYSQRDSDFVLALAHQIQQHGVLVWVDQWDIAPGADWNQAIDRAISDCAHILVVLSPSFVESREAKGDLLLALDEEKSIVPVLYQSCQMPRQLRLLQYIDFRNRLPDDEAAIQRILAKLAAPGEGAPPVEELEHPKTKSGHRIIQPELEHPVTPGGFQPFVARYKNILAIVLMLGVVVVVSYFGPLLFRPGATASPSPPSPTIEPKAVILSPTHTPATTPTALPDTPLPLTATPHPTATQLTTATLAPLRTRVARTSTPVASLVGTPEQLATAQATPIVTQPISQNVLYNLVLYDENEGVILANPDGKGTVHLVKGRIDYRFEWSPDHTRIVFETFYKDFNHEVQFSYAGSSQWINLTNNSAYDSAPTWSPDGKRIAFMSDRDGNHAIYIMNADGTQPTKLKEGFNQKQWLLNGKIALGGGNGNNLYTINPDGTDEQIVAYDVGPWELSPDQTKVYFYRQSDDALHITTIDSIELTVKPLGTSRLIDAAWSPDSTRIAFIANRDGNNALYIMNSDGSNELKFTEIGEGLVWSPDGSKIAGRDKDWNLFLISVNGTEFIQQEISVAAFAFSPDGKELAYIDLDRGALYIMNSDGSVPHRSYTGKFSQRIEWLSDETAVSINTNLAASPPMSATATPIYKSIQTVKLPAPPSVINANGKIVIKDEYGNSTLINANGTGSSKLGKLSLNSEWSWSPDRTKIAFDTNWDGNMEIYVTSIDGSSEVNLSNSPASHESRPTWSPDGKHIAFISDKGGNNAIWIMNADGSDPTKFRDIVSVWGLYWLQSNKLAYGDQRDLFTINLDGTNLFKIASDVRDLEWSPDQSKVYFFRDDKTLHILSADGDELSVKSVNQADRTSAVWSPDSKKVAFVANRDGKVDLYVMNSDGSNEIRLTNSSAIETLQSWSPDGTKILGGIAPWLESEREFFIVSIDGSEYIQLVIPVQGINLVFSPDSSKLAYHLRDGNQLFVINIDGSGQQLIYKDKNKVYLLDWLP